MVVEEQMKRNSFRKSLNTSLTGFSKSQSRQQLSTAISTTVKRRNKSPSSERQSQQHILEPGSMNLSNLIKNVQISGKLISNQDGNPYFNNLKDFIQNHVADLMNNLISQKKALSDKVASEKGTLAKVKESVVSQEQINVMLEKELKQCVKIQKEMVSTQKNIMDHIGQIRTKEHELDLKYQQANITNLNTIADKKDHILVVEDRNAETKSIETQILKDQSDLTNQLQIKEVCLDQQIEGLVQKLKDIRLREDKTLNMVKQNSGNVSKIITIDNVDKSM